jgi:hypothetical protein
VNFSFGESEPNYFLSIDPLVSALKKSFMGIGLVSLAYVRGLRPKNGVPYKSFKFLRTQLILEFSNCLSGSVSHLLSILEEGHYGFMLILQPSLFICSFSKFKTVSFGFDKS